MEVKIKTSMKCGSCLSRLRPHLDNHPGIEHWDAELEDPQKTLRVDLWPETNPEDVLELVRKVGFEAEFLGKAELPLTEEDSQNAKQPFKFSTYRPLFLVVSYVFAATLLMLEAGSDWSWSIGMTYFMGFFFLGFAFFKLLDISKFADAFSTYDIVAKRSRAYALAYPWIELLLGVLFVTQSFLLAANLATAIIMSVGLVGVVAAVRKKQAIQCACIGTAFNLPMSVVTIIENSVMIAMAVTMLVLQQTVVD